MIGFSSLRVVPLPFDVARLHLGAYVIQCRIRVQAAAWALLSWTSRSANSTSMMARRSWLSTSRQVSLRLVMPATIAGIQI